MQERKRNKTSDSQDSMLTHKALNIIFYVIFQSVHFPLKDHYTILIVISGIEPTQSSCFQITESSTYKQTLNKKNMRKNRNC